MVTRRVVAAVVLVAVVVAGLCVHLLLSDSAFSDIAGDVLYALASYVLVVIVVPLWPPPVAGAAALAWCIAVELFQLTGIPQHAAAAFPPAVLALGTVFDPRDLVVYVVTAVAAVTLDLLIGFAFRARSPQPTG